MGEVFTIEDLLDFVSYADRLASENIDNDAMYHFYRAVSALLWIEIKRMKNFNSFIFDFGSKLLEVKLELTDRTEVEVKSNPNPNEIVLVMPGKDNLRLVFDIFDGWEAEDRSICRHDWCYKPGVSYSSGSGLEYIRICRKCGLHEVTRESESVALGVVEVKSEYDILLDEFKRHGIDVTLAGSSGGERE